MLSSVLDLEFAKYSNEFLPGLKQILDTISNEDEKRTGIRLGAIECIGFIITSLRNQEGFLQEIDQIMEYFITLQSKLAKDDPEQGAIIDFYAQISSHMEGQFIKYLPHIYEFILEAVSINITFATQNEGNVDDIANKKFAITVRSHSKLLLIL